MNGDNRPEASTTIRAMNWRLFFLLWIASVIGIVLVLPYGLAMIPASLSSKLPPLHVLLPLELGQGAVFFGLVTLAGLFFANRTGLRAPILEAWLKGDEIRTKLNSIALPSVVVGVLSTLLILSLELVLFQPYILHENPASASALNLWAQPSAWKGLLASFYGAIDEELLLRLFAFSLFVWLGRFVRHKPDGSPTVLVLWVANTIAAILFGLGHLPMYAALVHLTPVIILRAVVLNGLLGMGFGYLYWTRGLECAMLSHFSADLVLHVVLAV